MLGALRAILASKSHPETSKFAPDSNEGYSTGMDSKTAEQLRADFLHRQEQARQEAELLHAENSQAFFLHRNEQARQQRANDSMVGGNHYKESDAVGTCPHCRRPIEHWDWSHNLRGLEYAITKYIARWRSKGGLESLKKAIHYTQKLIEIHFPGVVVRVDYVNSVQHSGGGIQECAQGQRAPEATSDPYVRTETGAVTGVVGGSSAYQESLALRCEAEAGFGVQCKNWHGHSGDHRF